MIIENLQRQDITALEEAKAFAKAISDFNLTPEQLARKVGVGQPHRITDRLQLLNLKEEYQEYLAKGFLTPTQAFYVSKVVSHNQQLFWDMIKTGRCDNSSLASVAQAFIDRENQTTMFGDEFKLSAEEVRAIKTLEGHIEKMFGTVSKCFNKDGEIDVLQKIDKNRAETVADKIKVICKSLQSVEKKLREPAAQQKVLEVTAC